RLAGCPRGARARGPLLPPPPATRRTAALGSPRRRSLAALPAPGPGTSRRGRAHARLLDRTLHLLRSVRLRGGAQHRSPSRGRQGGRPPRSGHRPLGGARHAARGRWAAGVGNPGVARDPGAGGRPCGGARAETPRGCRAGGRSARSTSRRRDGVSGSWERRRQCRGTARLAAELPAGLEPRAATEVPRSAQSIESEIAAFLYEVDLGALDAPPDPAAVAAGVARFAAAEAFPVRKRSRHGERAIDARRAVRDLVVTGPQRLRLEVLVEPEGTLKPGPLLGVLLDLPPDAEPLLRVHKLATRFHGSSPDRQAARPA